MLHILDYLKLQTQQVDFERELRRTEEEEEEEEEKLDSVDGAL